MSLYKVLPSSACRHFRLISTYKVAASLDARNAPYPHRAVLHVAHVAQTTQRARTATSEGRNSTWTIATSRESSEASPEPMGATSRASLQKLLKSPNWVTVKDEQVGMPYGSLAGGRRRTRVPYAQRCPQCALCAPPIRARLSATDILRSPAGAGFLWAAVKHSAGTGQSTMHRRNV